MSTKKYVNVCKNVNSILNGLYAPQIHSYLPPCNPALNSTFTVHILCLSGVYGLTLYTERVLNCVNSLSLSHCEGNLSSPTSPLLWSTRPEPANCVRVRVHHAGSQLTNCSDLVGISLESETGHFRLHCNIV